MSVRFLVLPRSIKYGRPVPEKTIWQESNIIKSNLQSHFLMLILTLYFLGKHDFVVNPISSALYNALVNLCPYQCASYAAVFFRVVLRSRERVLNKRQLSIKNAQITPIYVTNLAQLRAPVLRNPRKRDDWSFRSRRSTHENFHNSVHSLLQALVAKSCAV